MDGNSTSGNGAAGGLGTPGVGAAGASAAGGPNPAARAAQMKAPGAALGAAPVGPSAPGAGPVGTPAGPGAPGVGPTSSPAAGPTPAGPAGPGTPSTGPAAGPTGTPSMASRGAMSMGASSTPNPMAPNPMAGQTGAKPDAGDKKPIFKEWWFWVIIVEAVAIIGLFAGIMIMSSTPSKTTQNCPAVATPADDTTQTGSGSGSSNTSNDDYAIGDVVEASNADVTVVEVVRNLDPVEYGLDDISEDQELIAINVDVTNNTSKSQTYTGTEWILSDATGEEIPLENLGVDDEWIGGTIAAGKTDNGYLYYIIPVDETGLVLAYEDSDTSNTYYINLD